MPKFILALIVSVFGLTASVAKAQHRDTVRDLQQALLYPVDKNGEGMWWVAAVDMRYPGCQSLEAGCVGGMSARFSNKGGTFGVSTVLTLSYPAYKAYGQGKHFPGDMAQGYRDSQSAVTFSADGTFTWRYGESLWTCTFAGGTQFDCDWGSAHDPDSHVKVRFLRLILPQNPPSNIPRD